MEKNIVILDIDGVLADYRLGLLYWIRQCFPKYAQQANTHLLRSDTWINHESMEISYREWLGVLEMFRMSGGKRSIPVFEGALELVNKCILLQYKIILLTSRPIDIYSNIYRDTVEWLKDNRFTYNLLLWSKHKAEMIHKMGMIDEVVFAVDDEFSHIIDYTNLGILTYWVNWYNKSINCLNNKIIVVKDIKTIVYKLGEKKSG